MQERYLGDAHDFLKYALIRFFSDYTGLAFGLNWYLTRPGNVDANFNNDGEKRHHMNDQTWQRIDADLIEMLQPFQESQNRTLARFMDAGILPDNVRYHCDELTAGNRTAWIINSADALRGSQILFLDPDNGLEVQSMTRRTAPKYARYEDVAWYFDQGHSVICIQFARQVSPAKRAAEVSEKLRTRTRRGNLLPVLRGRSVPNILLFTMAQDEHKEKLIDAIHDFAAKSDKIEVM